ncbi:response regulator transcription factor [Nonomuraea basaltis]|uniref:response regulator transcription factor n=1 Tax=Nonomuraea basaltis TaxID=2495887 RepID=UPI0019810A4D
MKFSCTSRGRQALLVLAFRAAPALCVALRRPARFDHSAARALGASGFLLKDVTPEHLAASARLISAGDALLAPSITRRLVERFAAADRAQAVVVAYETGLVRADEGHP